MSALVEAPSNPREVLLAACRKRLQYDADATIFLRVSGDPGQREYTRLRAKGSPKGRVIAPDGEGNTIAEFSASEIADYLLGRGKYHAHEAR